MNSRNNRPFNSERSSPTSSPPASPRLLPLPLTTATSTRRSKPPKSVPRKHPYARVAAPSKDSQDAYSKGNTDLASSSEPYTEDDFEDSTATDDIGPAADLNNTDDDSTNVSDDADENEPDSHVLSAGSSEMPDINGRYRKREKGPFRRDNLLVERKASPSGSISSWTNSALKFASRPDSSREPPSPSFAQSSLSIPFGARDFLSSRRKASPGPGATSDRGSDSKSPSARKVVGKSDASMAGRSGNSRGGHLSVQPDTQAETSRLRYGGRSIVFRSWMLPEVALLTLLEAMAIDRLKDTLPPANISILVFIALVTPLLTLFRIGRRHAKENVGSPTQGPAPTNGSRSSHAPVVRHSSLVPAAQEAVEDYYMVPFTDSRGYRDVTQVDDGFAFAMIYPVLLASGVLWETQRSTGSVGLPLYNNVQPLGPSSAYEYIDENVSRQLLLESRSALLTLMSLNSFTLLLNVVIAKVWLTPTKIPHDNTARLYGALKLALGISLAVGLLASACMYITPLGLQGLSPGEAIASMFMYQLSLYAISRLARRGFSLGELGIASSSGVALCLEFGRLTSARWWDTWPAKTFRWPTPVISYMHVLIPGGFLIGFVLAPFLALSRNLAQQPAHKLKSPQDREKRRKAVSSGIYAGILSVCVGILGMWQTWILSAWRTQRYERMPLWWAVVAPWDWAFRFAITEGGWTRIGLCLYWIVCMVSAIGGWTTRMAVKKRRGTLGERRAGLRLDLRRKFFHALAVVMFVPGISLDPAFTSLAFSLAFSVFTLLEYARYFALYPIGRPIHVFMSEFIDQKDSGPVVLSHFYLLTASAGGVWLECGGTKAFSGVISVGVGDACASLIGKRIGGPQWPRSRKTVGGTAAFVLSVWITLSAIRVLGTGKEMPDNGEGDRWGILAASVLAGLLEASSRQNDNLVVPIYLWLTLCLMGGSQLHQVT